LPVFNLEFDREMSLYVVDHVQSRASLHREPINVSVLSRALQTNDRSFIANR
jgi:hypothetical protein